ncbi:MAG: hypothetical protein KKH94_11765 [Candidatus Omnitrophica bacterium]|nr:hypothetical protein [Candidatus Omnitrophota bacterium]
MKNIKNRHRKGIRIIAMVLMCLLTINNIVLSSADSINISKNTLSVQSSFQALVDEGIELSFQTQFEILTGIRLLLVGKNHSTVNGLLLETYGGGIEQGTSNIEFLPDIERNNDGNKVKAKFFVKAGKRMKM